MPDEDRSELEEAMKQVERTKIKPEKMLKNLERAQEKIKILKNERDELLRTNQKLVNIAKELETALSRHQNMENTPSIEDHSFNAGQDTDIEDIDREIKGVIETVRELRSLKNKQQD